MTSASAGGTRTWTTSHPCALRLACIWRWSVCLSAFSALGFLAISAASPHPPENHTAIKICVWCEGLESSLLFRDITPPLSDAGAPRWGQDDFEDRRACGWRHRRRNGPRGSATSDSVAIGVGVMVIATKLDGSATAVSVGLISPRHRYSWLSCTPSRGPPPSPPRRGGSPPRPSSPFPSTCSFAAVPSPSEPRRAGKL